MSFTKSPLSVSVSIVMALAVTVSPAASRILIVDDDGRDCPGATYRRIQDAVDAAAPGDTVEVCPGTYPEIVSVLKTLKLLGPKHGKDASKRNLSSTGEAVVKSRSPFFLGADNIVLDGFTVIVDTGEEGEGQGIETSLGYSGYQILNNVADATGARSQSPAKIIF